MGDDEKRFVSRGGLKLDAALDAFDLDVTGFVCVDLGCNVGGFTDCLLQRGARQVFAVDTGYGALAWKLRQDDRVVVMERTNALHTEPAVTDVDLAVIDLGWTKQRHAIPVALRWGAERIVTLIKPHYEAGGRNNILSDDDAERVAAEVLDTVSAMGVRVVSHCRSPIRGGKSKGKRGNVEYLALLEREPGV